VRVSRLGGGGGGFWIPSGLGQVPLELLMELASFEFDRNAAKTLLRDWDRAFLQAARGVEGADLEISRFPLAGPDRMDSTPALRRASRTAEKFWKYGPRRVTQHARQVLPELRGDLMRGLEELQPLEQDARHAIQDWKAQARVRKS